MVGMRYELLWSGKGYGIGSVGIMVKVAEVRKVSDIVMAVMMVFEVDVLRLICDYAPQGGRCLEE